MGAFVSVVMPVRDALPFLDRSIESILSQSHGDFEFVILDDGSTDGTTERLRQWAALDRRIRLFEGAQSLGPARSSNWVVAQASGAIVARMDADDISHPDRLRRQLHVLEDNPDACLVGSLWEGIDERGRLVRPRDRWRLARPSAFAPFPHGSIMFRRYVFERAGGYRLEANFWEDADLYPRMARLGRLLVLPDALYLHRSSPISTRLTSPPEVVEAAIDRMYRHMGGIASRAQTAPDAKVSPKVFRSLGSTRLWSGRSPAVLGGLLRRGAIGWNRQTAAILFWVLWGSASPRSLRLCMKALIVTRDYWVRKHVVDGQAYAWPGADAPSSEPTAAAAYSSAGPNPVESKIEPTRT